jgi:AcrR family transcriptional regulator
MIMKDARQTVSRREFSAREMKSKIFNTAIMLFSRHGYEKIRVDDIIKYARVSKGTFYAYFPSKDSVLVELFNRIDEHYKQAFKSVPPEETAANRLLIFVEALADYCTNVCGMQIMKVVYMNQISLNNRTPIINKKSRPFYTIMKDIVRLGKRTGEFPADISDDELGEFFNRAMRTVVYEWCLYDGFYDMHSLGKCHMSFLCKLLAARAAQNGQAKDLPPDAEALACGSR